MTSKDLTTHIEDIKKSLKTELENVDEKEIEKELTKFLDYGVPIEQAKSTIIKKFGGETIFDNQTNNDRKLISKLQPNDHNVNLLCRVISINPKEITVKGENRKIFYGILGDESGTVPFTAWNNIELEKEDVVEISNAYTREWQGNIQLNFGDRVNIKKTDKTKLPPEAFKPKIVKVNELKSGIGSVDIKVIIIEVNEREVNVNGEQKKVFSGIIGDETGKAQFTSWFDFKIKKDSAYQITGGYVKTWKGIPQLTFDENSTVKKLDKDIIKKEKISTKKMHINEIINKKGAIDIKIEGTIIKIKDGTGIITRCDKCNRALRDNECMVHGKIKGKTDLRIKTIVDDETGAINIILNRELSEKILNKKLQDYEKMKQEDVIKDITKKLFAQRALISGNALSDDFGTTLIAKQIEIIEIDIKQKSENILQNLEDLK